MNREKIWLHGDLSESPFASLLCRIRKSRRTGCLQVKTGKMEKKIEFKNGDICAAPDSINKNKFAKFLLEKKLISSSLNEKCQKHAKKHNSTYIQTLHEQDALPIEKLWKFIYSFAIEDLYPLFDIAKAEYFFNSDCSLEAEHIFFSIPTLSIISEGVRQMQNFGIIEAKMPKVNKTLFILTPDYMDEIRLNPPEKYISHLIESRKKMKDVLERSRLGKSTTKKIVFLLISLGLVSSSEKIPRNHHLNKLSQAKIHKIQEAFNRKCSYIYKYISKEIGPAAFNVLEKCFENTKPHLSPYSKDISLNSEGKFELQSALKTNISHSQKDFQQLFLKDLNEILAAEILAVKKSLGNEHESVLVKNLEKIGL